MSTEQGLSSDAVLSLVATKDGSIWLGTDTGVNRWKEGEITVYRRPRRRGSVRGGAPAAVASTTRTVLPRFREVADDGLPADSVDCVFEDTRARIWVATNDGAAILESGRFHPVASVPPGITFSIAEDPAGIVWFSHQEWLLRVEAARVVQRIPWATLGRAEPAISLLRDDAGDGLWVGFRGGGVARFKDGRVAATYATPEGVGSLHIDSTGTLWASTDAGLSRVEDPLTLTRQNGLPCDTVHWMMEDDAGSVWLSTACGLVRIAQSELDAWASKRTSTVHATVFDRMDGVGTHQFHYGYNPIVAKSAGGKLWYTFFGGVSVIDPHGLPVNPLRPPVHIEQITADGQTYDAADGLRLPAGVRDLSFEFTALSLVVPERVRFRVKLEGQDNDWRDLINKRHVQYTNLRPRTYRLRVLAANNDGLWNEDGAALQFTIAPAFYQTYWFRALVAAMFATLLWAAYRVRMRIVERHTAEISALNEQLMTAQEQERTRIAGELHDSVMQRIAALSLVLGTAKRKIPPDSGATEIVGGVQRQLIDVGVEIRQISHDLHPPVLQAAGLPEALRGYCEAFGQARAISICCHADYSLADLSPGASLALYRIAQEAVGNAVKHAGPTRINVRLARQGRNVVLTVTDDGRGCDPEQIGPGGLGLINMRERARQLNGTFEVDSRPGRGTTVQVAVPFRARAANRPADAEDESG
jgi:signal transduction histidine kinase